MDSSFYTDLLGKLGWCYGSIKLNDVYVNTTVVMIQEKVVAESPYDIICYGVGSIQESKNAQFQFVLALLMRDLLEVCDRRFVFALL